MRNVEVGAKKRKISLTAINELISDLKRTRFGSIRGSRVNRWEQPKILCIQMNAPESR